MALMPGPAWLQAPLKPMLYQLFFLPCLFCLYCVVLFFSLKPQMFYVLVCCMFYLIFLIF